MAAVLQLDLTYLCGAVLIDINVVLTAAHCVARYVFSVCSCRLIIEHCRNSKHSAVLDAKLMLALL